MRRFHSRSTAIACAVFAFTAAHAQQTVVITGNPLGRDAATQPVSVLSGEGLLLRRAGTLGETLDGLPGVSASWFGPNSSRPVIRGLDGDRVRLLDNGGASVDASNLSFDHASATDPLVAERIEVLRGPAALLYGGNATGGVVNSIDNRIPRVPATGLSGRAEVRFGGPADERSGAAVFEGGSSREGGGPAWHADVFGRQGSDLRVPRYTPVTEGAALPSTDRVRNSASRSEGGAVGAGWASEKGFLGAAVETVRNRYGTTAEPDVFIRMQRDRVAVAGERRALDGPITQVSAQASHTRYEHQEISTSGVVGTTFRSRGDDLRLELRHAPLGPLHGVFGVQAETLDFSALGAEAFVPNTQTKSTALFALEEWNAGPLVFSAGLRGEQVRVASAGDAPDAAEPHFGAARTRSFSPGSLSLAARIGAAQGWHGSLSLGRTERAPAYYELFADGLHVATAAFERGDPQLPTESSRHAEIDLGWASGPHSVKASVFDTRFSRFISLDATGNRFAPPDDPERSLPEYAFRAVRAHMSGVEIEGRTRLLEAPFTLDLTGGFDTVRGDNQDRGEPLPRLAPRRVRAGLEAALGTLHAGLNWRNVARQSRVPASDTATAGYSMLDLWASGRVALGDETTWFARLGNATNRLAYNAATIDTIRGLAPLPGRSLTVGLRARF